MSHDFQLKRGENSGSGFTKKGSVSADAGQADSDRDNTNGGALIFMSRFIVKATAVPFILTVSYFLLCGPVVYLVIRSPQKSIATSVLGAFCLPAVHIAKNQSADNGFYYRYIYWFIEKGLGPYQLG